MADAQGRAKIPSVTRFEVETASRPPLESQDKPALTTGSQESRGETVGSDSKCRESADVAQGSVLRPRSLRSEKAPVRLQSSGCHGTRDRNAEGRRVLYKSKML